MNCPNCGAKNDADARFCAECGTPLDNAVLEAAKVEGFEEADEEQTIISTADEIAVEAKTLTVDQAEVMAAVEEVDNTEEADDEGSTSEPESSSPPLESAPAGAGGDDQNGGGMDGEDGSGESGSNRTLIIVGVIVVVVLLLCCCCSVLVGGVVGSDPGAVEDLIEEISMLPVYLPLI